MGLHAARKGARPPPRLCCICLPARVAGVSQALPRGGTASDLKDIGYTCQGEAYEICFPFRMLSDSFARQEGQGPWLRITSLQCPNVVLTFERFHASFLVSISTFKQNLICII